VEIDDDWEEPDRFWQVLSMGGFVTNMDDEEGRRVSDALAKEDHSVTVEDIYGDEAILICKHIVAMKIWTKRGGMRWKKRNARWQINDD
jgi:hypothetical protein